MHRILIVALVAVVSGFAGETIAASAAARVPRNPVSAADWKVWMALDADAARLSRTQLAPEYAKCAKLKHASAIGICDAKPLSQQARRIATYVTTIGDMAKKLPQGQCRLALTKYEFALQAALSAAIVVNKELILADQVLWKSGRTLEKQIKSVLRTHRADSERLCRP
jgi:hypothetical protein